MNTGESAPQAPGQEAPLRAAEAARKSDAAKAMLGKALDALFKAQEHLNAAADQGGALAKVIDGINQSLRGLQREVSQVIYRADKDTHPSP
jgi:hypothetical protein